MNLSFKHSGDLGDIIFSLPLVKALGGGSFYFSRSEKGFTREEMTESRAKFLMPLIGRQSCIKNVEMYRGQAVAYDLDHFRRFWFGQEMGSQRWVTIAEWHCRAFGVDPSIVELPWLECDLEPVAEVVINRTSRYHGNDFQWKRVVQKYAKKAVFVGLEEEHEAFVSEFGFVRHRPVTDALDLANVIAGCRLFIGNQSLPEAIAEGLKKDKILEVPIVPPTSLYPRANAQYVFSPCLWLPEI